MSHGYYVIVAYVVFVVVLGWDFLAPQLRLKAVRRGIALRQRRENARKKA